MTLANQVIDFVDDVDRRILKQVFPAAPEHIKTASVLSAEDRERLDSGNFALVLQTKEAQALKKFPMIDAANTWLSCQYFIKTAEQLPFVAQKIAASNLNRACALYNLKAPEEISKLASKDITGNRYDELRDWKKDRETMQTKIAKAAEPDGSEHFYALGSNYAMPSSDYVKKAAAYFVDNFNEFQDAEDRHTFADNVLSRAQELKVELECKPFLEKYASADYGDSVMTQINLRKDALQHRPEMTAALDKLAAHRSDTEAKTFAKALYLFDKKAGLTRHYGKGQIADAFKATFSDFFKSAGYRWEDESSGLSITDSQLTKAASDKYDKIKSYFGSTLADSLKKEAVSIFDSLPADAKETIVKISKGVI